MFFMRKERKRCIPCVKLAIIGLSIIGAVAVVDKSKCFMKEKLCCVMNMFKMGGSKSTGNCQNQQ